MTGSDGIPRTPRVSVIIPTYNRAAAVCEAVESAVAQTFQDLEVLVVDDGSTDGTGGALRDRFAADPRVRCLVKANEGPGAARNHGIRHARGEMIAFLDSDDLWTRDKLELQVRKLDEEPGAALVFCDRTAGGEPVGSRTRWQEVRFTGDTSLRSIIEKGFPISTPGVVMRRRVLEEIGLFDESFVCAEDWDLWIRVLARYPIAYVDRPLTIVRRMGDSISQTRTLAKWRCWLRLWLKHRELLLRAGCPGRVIRARVAHAHKKVAQTAHRLGSLQEARVNYLAWWRCEPWRLRGLIWWVALALRRSPRRP